jgi:hypothetical protein
MELGGQLHAASAAAHWVGPQTQSGRFGKEESLVPSVIEHFLGGKKNKIYLNYIRHECFKFKNQNL